MKETYTIYIVPSSQSDTKRYSIHRWSIVSLILLFSFVIIGAIGSIIWANFLNFEVRSKDGEYKLLEAKYQSREVEFNNISKEIEDIRELDSQLRELSGLRGQGGAGGVADEDAPDALENATPTKSYILPETGEPQKPSLLKELRRLKYSLQQHHAKINDDMDGWARIPSINPLQKGRCWYTSGFGKRPHPLTGKWHFHRGLDIAARRGTSIAATGKGVIEHIKRDAFLGLTIKIRHDSTHSTVYGHLSKTTTGLKKGDEVLRHDIIGEVGSSGRTTGPHLHYEVHVNGKAVNPRGYIIEDNAYQLEPF